MTFRRSVLGAVLAGGLTVTLLSGCGSSSSKPTSGPAPTPTDIGGSISSAISSGASEVSSAASKAASAASSAFAQITGGIDATGDVSAGPVDIGSDGHAESKLTVDNKTGDQHTYTVSVSFVDSGGGLQDVVVVTVENVPGHGQSTATAKSNRKLSGALTAKVSAAVRH